MTVFIVQCNEMFNVLGVFKSKEIAEKAIKEKKLTEIEIIEFVVTEN